MSERTRNALFGVGMIIALGVMAWVMTLFLGGAFRSGFRVEGVFPRAGQLLRAGSDVKMRGVLVGTVDDIDVRSTDTAVVTMLIQPEHEIPRNVGAAIRAKTLFGEKFIDIELPADPSAEDLQEGDRIPLDRTIGPFEVETILEKAVPILEAIDPEDLSAALNALVEGFVGNEQALRDATVQGERALVETRETLPNLGRNIAHLENLSASLDDIDRDLVEALENLEQAGQTLRENEAVLGESLDHLTPLVRDLADVFLAREADLIDLTVQGADVLEEVERKAPQIPDLVRVLDGFLATWIADLTNDAGEPLGYWQISAGAATDGQPYGPGNPPPEPRGSSTSDRAGLLERLGGSTEEGVPGVGDVLTAPMDDEALGRLLDRLEGDAREGVVP